jgi:hypothetical protein
VEQRHALVTGAYPCLARVISCEEQRLSSEASQFRSRAWHRDVSLAADRDVGAGVVAPGALTAADDELEPPSFLQN